MPPAPLWMRPAIRECMPVADLFSQCVALAIALKDKVSYPKKRGVQRVSAVLLVGTRRTGLTGLHCITHKLSGRLHSCENPFKW